MRPKFDPDIEMAVYRRGGWLAVSARLNLPIELMKARATDQRHAANRAGLLAMIRSLPIEERRIEELS